MKQTKIKYFETNKDDNTIPTRGWGQGKWGQVGTSVQTSSYKMNKFWESNTQHCNNN